MAAVQGNVNNAMLKAVGREQGPDYMLKILPEDLTTTFTVANNPISAESSITEVLNVVSYLCSGTRTGNLIDTNNSVTDGATPSGIGNHDPATGLYGNTGAIADTFISATTGRSLFDINGLTPNPDAANRIPVGILRRTAPAAAPAADPSWGVRAPIDASTGALVIPIMSDCIKQMINILVKTREIFGPKGWTDLFQKVKGGGAGSKHAKRTHRQHRRRYSSKQY
jgi:hypothetical protein